jgi:myo-inositol-1-phosphate synthase
MRPIAILTSGFGAVTTTFLSGLELIRRGRAKAIGSVSQFDQVQKMGINVNNFVFGGWDIVPDDAFQVACKAKVLSSDHLALTKKFLKTIKPMKGVFDSRFLKSLPASHIKKEKSKWVLAQKVRADIRAFLSKHRCERGVFINCTSTEAFPSKRVSFKTLNSFEKALRKNHAAISPSCIYVYAALMEGLPVANATPNPMGEEGWLQELSAKMKCPIAGSDLKTGQTLIKTILAPGLQRRRLGVRGWYSTNILGNRDGYVLNDPANFKSKRISKKNILKNILSANKYPELYGNLDHQINIQYYPPQKNKKKK